MGGIGNGAIERQSQKQKISQAQVDLEKEFHILRQERVGGGTPSVLKSGGVRS